MSSGDFVNKVDEKWLKEQKEQFEEDLKNPDNKKFFDETLGETIKRINNGQWDKQHKLIEEKNEKEDENNKRQIQKQR